MSQPQQYKLITTEELEEAVKNDPYYKDIADTILADEAEIKELLTEIRLLTKPITDIRYKIQRRRQRIHNRKSQLRHITSQIRNRIAWKKIEETRTRIGI